MRARLLRHAGASLLVFAGLVVLSIIVPEHRVSMLNVFMTFVVLAISLDLMVGNVFMLAMGHAAFFGGGAYVSTLLQQEWGWSMPVSAVAAVVIVAFTALMIGGPAAARTAGLYFSIVTFAFGEILVQIVNNTTEITGGSEGLAVLWGAGSDLPFDWSIYRYFSFWIAGCVLVTMVIASIVRNSHFGLRLSAVRGSEDMTRGLAFNPTFYKAAIFVLGSTLAGMVGIFYAPMVGFITPELMEVTQSIFILGLVMVGGTRSMLGSFIGVGLLATLPQYLELDPVTRPIVVGVAMMFVILTSPKRGIAGWIYEGPGIVVRWLRRLRAPGPVAAPASDAEPIAPAVPDGGTKTVDPPVAVKQGQGG